MITTSTVQAVITAPAIPREQELVRIYNRSRKPYTHGAHISGPNSFVTLPRWLGEKWLAMFPEDFVAGDAALASINPAQAEYLGVLEKNKKLEAEKKAMEDELAALRNQISGRGQPLG